jgi:hypothetical protein
MNKTKIKTSINKKPLKKKTNKKAPLTKKVNVKKDNINTNTIKINIGNTKPKTVYKRSYNIAKAKTQERQNVNPYANPYINFNNNTHKEGYDNKFGNQLNESLKLIKNQNDRFDELHRSVNSLLVPKVQDTTSLSYISNPVNQQETQTENEQVEQAETQTNEQDIEDAQDAQDLLDAQKEAENLLDYNNIYPEPPKSFMNKNELESKARAKYESKAKANEEEAQIEPEANIEEPQKKERAKKEYNVYMGEDDGRKYIKSKKDGNIKDIEDWKKSTINHNVFIDPNNPSFHINISSGIYSNKKISKSKAKPKARFNFINNKINEINDNISTKQVSGKKSR